VYNRKRHFVNIRAAKRFLRAFLTTNDGKKENFVEVTADLEQVFLVLGEILAEYYTGDLFKRVVDALNIILSVLRGQK